MDRHIAAMEKLAEGTFIPAHPLALDAGRKLDEKRQRLLSRYYLEAGAGGLAVGVHTTQFEIRNPEISLYEPILRITADEADAFERRTGKTIVRVAGVCGPISQAVGEAETARGYGYDAVLLSPGGLGLLSESELLARTETIAGILPVIGFYLQPSVGGRVFSYDYWEKFCEIDNVAAIKCAPFNRYQTLDVVRAVSFSSRADKIALYTGNDDNIVLDLITPYRFCRNGEMREKRFVGGLLGHWAVWTKTAVELFTELKQIRVHDAVPSDMLARAAEVTDANAAFFDAANGFAGCIAGIHEVLRRQGLFEGIWCLDEKETLSPGQMQEIDRVYRLYPHLQDDAFVAEFIRQNV
jgi:hypothetical protein